MLVTGLTWDPPWGCDVHGMKGTPTRPLHEHVLYRVLNDDGSDGTLRPDAVQAVFPQATLLFQPRFEGEVRDDGGRRRFHGHGVEVDMATGVVTTTADWPTSPTLWTFRIEVSVTGLNVPTQLAADFTPLKIRVHLHTGISELQLTPSELTVNETNSAVARQQFTVVARFADGTVGDVSEDVPTWTQSGWSKVPRDTDVSPDLLELDAATGAIATGIPHGTWTVRLDLPALGTGSPHAAQAVVKSDRPWASSRQLTFVAGRRHAWETSGNLLFLSEGFAADDQALFEECVRKIVRRLREPSFRPIRDARRHLNYWMVFLPSPAAGTTMATEQFVRQEPGGPRADPARRQVPPPDTPGGRSWTAEMLAHEVGWPVPEYEDNGPSDDQRESDWRQLYGAHVSRDAYGEALADWQGADDEDRPLIERTLLSDVDSTFGLVQGGPPAMTAASPYELDLHPRRAKLINLQELWTSLRYGDANVGSRWGPGKPDEGRVVFLCRSQHTGGSYVTFGSGAGFAVLPIGSDQHLDCTPPVSGPIGWSIDVGAIPAVDIPRLTGGVAHELGHSVRLGEEYGSGGTTPAPTRTIARIEALGNLHHHTTVAGPPGLDLEQVKWQRWPRITKAGIVTSGVLVSGRLEITLERRQASRFVPGDVVRLRTRDLLAATPGDYSDLLTVDQTSGDSVSVTGSSLPTPDDLKPDGRFGPGAKLVAVVVDDQDQPLPLLSRLVKAHVETAGTPVNRPDGSACAPPVNQGMQAPVSLPAHLLEPGLPHAERVVALYDGGEGYDCGVYHPTGACLMRMSYAVKEGVASGEYELGSFFEFCHVCRYVLADALDVTAHARIDRQYVKRKLYPA